jgi:hypothetical protein
MTPYCTRKVPLRSVCRNADTSAAIRFVVEHVATPLRVRLLDFLRHFVVCRTDPTFRCATCDAAWQQECGLAPRRPGRKLLVLLLLLFCCCYFAVAAAVAARGVEHSGIPPLSTVRERAPTEAHQDRLHQRLPPIDINLLQAALALVTTSKQLRQRHGLLAHFYEAHFAPLLCEDLGGPVVDITAHHQVVVAVFSRRLA